MPKKSILTPLIKSIVLVGLYLLFHEPIELVLNKLIINPFLIHFQGSILKDLIVLTFILILGWLKFQNKLGSFEHLVTILLVSFVIYLPYRLNYIDIWSFEPLSTFKVLKYSDGLFLLFLILVYPKREIIKDNSKNTLFEDLPFKSKNEEADILNHESYATEIADRIKENNFEKSFAVGINGKWGSGKTSFISMLRENLEKNGEIIVEFNPWSSKNEESISEDFFEELDNKLIENQILFGNLILSYSNKIINKNSNQILNWINPFYASKQPESYLKSRLEKSIKQLKNKVIVIIDDLDRLNKSEILEVLKIIRNTANFQNLIFVVAYDREYIRIQLNENSNHENNQFLEKIFQLEITLPYFEKDILKSALHKNIIQILNGFVTTEPSKKDYIIKLIKEIDENGYNLFHPELPLIDNLRDVTRLSNNISINYKKLIGEVNLNELIALEVLRLKEIEIYETLKNNFNYFLNSNYGRQALTVKGDGGMLREVQNLKESLHYKTKDKNYNNDEILKKLIEKIIDEKYSINKAKKCNEIESILLYLFAVEKGLLKRQSDYHNLSIVKPSRFTVYFYYYLPNNKLPIFKLIALREQNIEGFNKLIQNKIKEGLEKEITEFFQRIDNYNDEKDFQNIIFSYKTFLKTKSILNNGKFIFENNTFYKKEDFFERIKHLYNKYSFENDTHYQEIKEGILIYELKSFLNPNTIDESVIFESDLIQHLIIKRDQYQELTEKCIKHLIEISENILSKYTSNKNCINQKAISLFLNTNSGKETYSKNSKSIILNLISKDFKTFFESCIWGPIGRSRSDYKISEFILVLFNEGENKWEYFENFIKENNNTQAYYIEFLKFYELFKEKNFQPTYFSVFNELEIDDKNRIQY